MNEPEDCYNGIGELEEVKYISNSTKQEVIKTGMMKSCGGCLGNKISVRAQKWRVENNYIEME